MEKESQTVEERPPLALTAIPEQAKVSKTTVNRWRSKGWLQTVNIAGKIYVPAASMIEFNRRAARGDFAVKRRNPNKAVKQPV
jgi:hypothetical protein